MIKQMEIPFAPTEEQICQMCLWSSGCDGCCYLCRGKGTDCNAQQLCGLTDVPGDQVDRWHAWLNIIKAMGGIGERTGFIPLEPKKPNLKSLESEKET